MLIDRWFGTMYACVVVKVCLFGVIALKLATVFFFFNLGFSFQLFIPFVPYMF